MKPWKWLTKKANPRAITPLTSRPAPDQPSSPDVLMGPADGSAGGSAGMALRPAFKAVIDGIESLSDVEVRKLARVVIDERNRRGLTAKKPEVPGSDKQPGSSGDHGNPVEALQSDIQGAQEED